MNGDVQWVVGLGVSLWTAYTVAMVAAFRNLASRLSSGDKDLHNRIDEVKEKYVRRDDLDNHIMRLETGIRDIKDEQRQNHKQVMEFLSSQR